MVPSYPWVGQAAGKKQSRQSEVFLSLLRSANLRLANTFVGRGQCKPIPTYDDSGRTSQIDFIAVPIVGRMQPSMVSVGRPSDIPALESDHLAVYVELVGIDREAPSGKKGLSLPKHWTDEDRSIALQAASHALSLASTPPDPRCKVAIAATAACQAVSSALSLIHI
eukprot:7727085-Alexandrium_andersonii.AAC.1